jgi:formyltetrahydrofolate hydrolase
MPFDHQFVHDLSCRDIKRILHAVSHLLYQTGCRTVGSQQFGAGRELRHPVPPSAPVGRQHARSVLTRAVRWQVEHRVLINGHKCAVLR